VGRLVGISFMPGTDSNQSAFWSKVAGIYGIVFSILHLTKDGEPEDMSILIACDGKLVVDRLNSTKLIQASEAHYNLLSAIQKLRKSLPMTSRLTHMKGHQDMGTMTVLPRQASMNIEMDMAAKEKVDKNQMESGAWHIPGEPWSCQITGQKLVKNIEKQLWEHMMMEPIMTYWKTKGKVTEPKMPMDWESMGTAMMESSTVEKWACKFTTGFFGHEKMSQWKIQSSTQCP